MPLPKCKTFAPVLRCRRQENARTHCVTRNYSGVSLLSSRGVRACVRACGCRACADILDPALLRPGRLDRKIEIPLPNETSRLDIIKIHSAPITKHGEIDFESVVKVRERWRSLGGQASKGRRVPRVDGRTPRSNGRPPERTAELAHPSTTS